MKVLVLVHHRGADASKKKLRTFVYSCHYKCALQYALLFIEKYEKYKSFLKTNVMPKFQVSNMQFPLTLVT